MNRTTATTIRYALRGALLATAVAIATPAHAQLNGENLLGDMGVKSGTQPMPGVYVGNMFYRYFTDTVKGPNGETVVLDQTGSGKQTINASVPLIVYVSSKKFLGAHIGAMAVVPVAKGALEAPGLGVSEEASTGLSDLYIQPLQLGWTTRRADIIAGVALFAPTGRYTAGASDNLGKGMWSYELSAGTTVYLDPQRSWSIAATGFWETHSRKSGEVRIDSVTLNNVKVGQLVTVEGGIAKSFMHGAAHVGVAYYGQWKVTDDQLGTASSAAQLAGIPARHRVFGIGPDVTIPIASKTRLLSFVNVRYLWETGAAVKTQGQSLIITSTIPVGGIKIAGR
jgi:hypothetical protein